MAALYALLLAVVCIMQQLSGVSAFTVEFAEQDGSGNEGQTVTFTVGVSGIVRGPVHVELVALTASEFEEGGFGTLSDEQAATNPAERSDLLIHSPEHVFTPISGDTPEPPEDAQFQILLVDDDLNEEREVFFLYVNVTEIEDPGDQDDGGDRRTAAGFINVDSDDITEVTFGLDGGTPGSEANLYEMDESVGEVNLTLDITHPPEDNITINVDIISSSATEGSDLSLASTQVVLTSEQTTYSIRCIIHNDIIPEEEERARIQLMASDVTQLTFLTEDFLNIAIIDDDSVIMGFTTDQVAIREGESAEVTVAFLDPPMVELSVQLDVNVLTGIPDGTASAGEVNTVDTLTLTSTQESFTVHIIDNDRVENDRFFTIKLSTNQGNPHHTISPASLRINILDNDTDISYGIKNVNPDSPVTVEEGDQITITVGIVEPKESFQPDDDFVVACSVKIVYENASAADIEGSTALGVVSLTGSSPSQDFTITTKENEEIQENRVFYVILEQISMNSPLVKIETGSATIIIKDDDGLPNKPEVTITDSGNDFTITWNITITKERPVTGYEIRITGKKEDGSPGDIITRTAGPDDTSLTAPYDIDGTRYPMYDIVVCAVNEAGTTCSDNKPFALPFSGDDGNDGGGLSGGATAAIVIIILILLFLLVVFLVVGLLWMKSRWRDYPPRKTEEKNPDFQQGRMSYGEPQP